MIKFDLGVLLFFMSRLALWYTTVLGIRWEPELVAGSFMRCPSRPLVMVKQRGAILALFVAVAPYVSG